MSLTIPGTKTEDDDGIDISPPSASERPPLVLAPETTPPETPTQPGGARRSNWAAIGADIVAARENAPKPGRMSDETRNAALRSVGLDPDDYGPPRPLAELPRISNPDVQDIGYSDEEVRLSYDQMSDPDKLRFVALSTDRNGLALQETAAALRQQRIEMDKASITFPEDDIDAIVRDLGPVSREHIEKMMADPEGSKWIRDQWTRGRVSRLVGEKTLEYANYAAQAIDGDSAVALADFRRRMDDEYGGKLTAAYNLGADFVSSGGRQVMTGLSMAAEGLSRLSDWSLGGPDIVTGETSLFERVYGRKPTEEDLLKSPEGRRLLANPISKDAAGTFLRGQADLANQFYYRPEAKTGSFVYDKVLSPLSSGLGSVAASIATSAVNPGLGMATMWGASKDESYRSLIAAGVDEGNAHLISDFAGTINAALEYVGIERIMKGWRSFSPGWQTAIESIAKPLVTEGVTEGAQQFVTDAGTEIGRSTLEGHEFNLGRFINETLPNVLESAVYGALTGAVAGGAGSRPVRTAGRHVDWRRGQRMLSRGVETLKKAPATKAAPDRVSQIGQDIIQKTGAPQTMFQDADTVRTLFPGDDAGLENYLATTDVTRQAFDHALEANAQIEVSSFGLMRYLAQDSANPDLQKITQITPDSPQLGVMAQEEEDKAAIVEEINRIRKENQSLPEPFRVYREQVAEATGDEAMASDFADTTLAMARIAGKRLGLTPEQWFNLNPIQVVLANGLKRARSFTDIADAREMRAIEREDVAAQDALRLYQAERKGRYEFVPAPDGGIDHGIFDIDSFGPEVADTLKAAGMASGFIRLERGNRHFGKVHIEREHSRNLAQAGFSSAEEYVEHVADNFSQIRKAANGRHILIAPGEGGRVLVLNLDKTDGDYYTVTTGYILRRGQKIPGELLWSMDAAQPRDSGGPARLLSPDTELPGGAEPLSNDGQSISPITTIPPESADVKALDAEALRVILEQSGITPEQAETLRQYAQNLIERGEDVSDAEQLGRDVMNAVTTAEGLEQAAAGLERILARPEEIGQAVLDALGMGDMSLQEGIATIRKRMESLQKRAAEWRNFFQTPGRVAELRDLETMAQDRRQRGDVTFSPDVTLVRLFNGRQDRTTIAHEIFGHVFFRELEKAVKSGKGSAQDIADYNAFNRAVEGGLDSTDPDIRRSAEETIAKMGEKYLSEGKAPTPFLSEAFTRFRSWFTNIYSQVKSFAGIELTDDVRGAFDRLIASEEEIAYARDFYNDRQQFMGIETAPEDKRGKLRELAETARRSAEEIQVSKVVSAYMKAIGGRREFSRQAREQLSRQRQYRAVQALKDIGGLSRADVEQEIGIALADKLQENHKGIIKKNPRKGDVAPADMAAIAVDLGYKSQYEMTMAIVDAAKGVLPTDADGRVTNLEAHAMAAVHRLIEGGGMDEMYIVDNFGNETADMLRAKYGDDIYSRPGGLVGAVMEAERYGYDSVASLLTDIAETPSFWDALRSRTDEMVAAEEARIRAVAIEDAPTAADEAYHNDHQAAFMAARQRVLDDQAARQAKTESRRMDRMMSDRALREAAAFNVSQKSGRKAGQYSIAVESFKRHGKNAAMAEAKKDYILAAKELRLQRLAHYEIREAIQAREELAEFPDYWGVNNTLRRLDGGKGQPKVEFGYREAIKDIITAFKVNPSFRLHPEQSVGAQVAIPGPQGAEMESYLPAMSEAIPPWIINREGAADIKSWKDLSLEKIRELDKALKDLERIGRGKLEGIKAGRLQSIEQFVHESIVRMDERPDRPETFDEDEKRGKRRNFLERFGLSNILTESLFAMADGNTNIRGMGVGPLQSAFLSIRDGLDNKSVRLRKANETIRPAIRTLQKFSQRFKNINPARLGPLPESLRSVRDKKGWTGELAIMCALNSGNAGNLKALLQGYGITEQQWRAIAATMNNAEWDAVQTIWDTIGEFYPDIDAVTFRLVNRHVKREAAQAFAIVTAEGTEKEMRGGYFPLIYDAMIDADYGRFSDAENIMNRQHSQSIHSFTKIAKNFTESRATDEQGAPVSKRPPMLRLSLIETHLDKVAHYICLADAIQEMDRITLNEDWAKVFRKKMGYAAYETVRQWLKDVADPDSGNLRERFAQKVLGWMREKATVAALGLNLTGSLKQFYGAPELYTHMRSHSRTGRNPLPYLWKAARQVGWKGNLGMMNEKFEMIFEKSAMMKNRDGNVNVELRDMISRLQPDAKVYNIAGVEFTVSDLRNQLFFMTQMADRSIACTGWLAQYMMSMEGHGTFDIAGLTAEQIEAGAIRDANMAAATQASSTRADLTAMQRSQIMRMFTTFISGNIRRWSRSAQYWDAMKQGQVTKGQFVSNFLIENALQAWIPGFLGMVFKSLSGDDDDPSVWDYLSMLFLDPVITLASGVPGLNLAGGVVERGARAGTPPTLEKGWQAVANVAQAPKQLAEGEYSKLFKSTASAVGYYYGVPEKATKAGFSALEAVGVLEESKKKGRK